jgi:hypothetical protein
MLCETNKRITDKAKAIAMPLAISVNSMRNGLAEPPREVLDTA